MMVFFLPSNFRAISGAGCVKALPLRWQGASNKATLNASHQQLEGTILVGSDSKLKQFDKQSGDIHPPEIQCVSFYINYNDAVIPSAHISSPHPACHTVYACQ